MAFAQYYSSQSRKGCPKRIRFRPAFELSALSRIAVKGGGISGLIHCRSRVTCAGALEVVGLAGRLRARLKVTSISPSGKAVTRSFKVRLRR